MGNTMYGFDFCRDLGNSTVLYLAVVMRSMFNKEEHLDNGGNQ